MPAAATSNVAGAAVKRASEAAGQYQEVAGQTVGSVLKAGGSIVSNIANVISTALVGQVREDLRGIFVAKPIVEHLDINGFQIKNLADGAAESDAVTMRKLQAYVFTESANAIYFLKLEVFANTEADARYVKNSELAQKVAPLLQAARHSPPEVRVKEGTIRINRQNIAIDLAGTSSMSSPRNGVIVLLVLLVE